MSHDDKSKIIAAFNKAALTYDEAAIVQLEAGNEMLERLEYVNIEPRVILDVGASTGFFSRALEKKYPKARVISTDIAFNMLQQAKHQRKGWFSRQDIVTADADGLPLADESVDFIFSNFMLQWSPDLQKTLQELWRVLKPDGLLMFTTVGPDTLKELKNCWQSVDGCAHVNDFLDMHDVGDMLMRVHFSEPVIDMNLYRLTYRDVNTILRDLKAIGSVVTSQNKNTTLSHKKNLLKLSEHYESYRDSEGCLPVTYEVIFGHAWKGKKPQQTINEHGEVMIPISRLQKR